MNLRVYFLETRPQFLILSAVLVFLSVSMALYFGSLHWGYAILCLAGLTLLHTSVNVLNDYFDYKSGVDFKTKRTPFSGGSGLLVEGKISPQATLALGLISFVLTLPIGLYFVLIYGWGLLLLFLFGAFLVLSYTSWLTKLGNGIPELSAGLGLGTLPVIGMYVILSSGFKLPALYASIPSGLLVANLLLLNEVPDSSADKTAGRKTLPIVLGRHKSIVVYAILTALVYLWTVLGVVLRVMPISTLIALLTVPIAVRTIRIALKHTEVPGIIPALAGNVQVVLLTQVLLAIGYIIARII